MNLLHLQICPRLLLLFFQGIQFTHYLHLTFFFAFLVFLLHFYYISSRIYCSKLCQFDNRRALLFCIYMECALRGLPVAIK